MFRDQTEADLFSVKVPVRQGIDGATGANPSTDDPNSGANRDGSEFAAYLEARRENAAIAEARRKRRTGTGREETGAGRSRSGEDAADGNEVRERRARALAGIDRAVETTAVDGWG